MKIFIIMVCCLIWYAIGLGFSYIAYWRMGKWGLVDKFNESFFFIMALWGPLNIAALVVW